MQPCSHAVIQLLRYHHDFHLDTLPKQLSMQVNAIPVVNSTCANICQSTYCDQTLYVKGFMWPGMGFARKPLIQAANVYLGLQDPHDN